MAIDTPRAGMERLQDVLHQEEADRRARSCGHPFVAYPALPPPPGLALFVRCLWVRRAERDAAVDVLPDGCIDVLVRGERAALAGPDTRPFPTPVRAGETIVGARFHPGAAGAALGVVASEL